MKFGTHFRRYPARMRLANVFLLSTLLGTSLTAFAQVPTTDTTRAAPRPVPRLAVPRDSVRLSAANVDSLERAPVPLVRMKFSPRQITRRSMIIPGWGQATMKQYWALPIIYGGFGALGYYVARWNREVARYQKGYEIVGPQVYNPNGTPGPNPRATYPIDGQELNFTQLSQGRKFFQRYRDICFIGMGFLYGLNVVQANVSAHLKTFDETDDISLRLQPGASNSFGVTPFGATLTLSFSSKSMRE